MKESLNCTNSQLCCHVNRGLFKVTFFVFSNDKNLCTKALLCGIKAFSKKDLESEVKGFNDGPPLQNFKTSTIPHTSHHASIPAFGKLLSKCIMIGDVFYSTRTLCLLTENKRLGTREVEEETKWDVSREVCVLEECLRDVLSEVVEMEMKAVYDDLWLEVDFNFGFLKLNSVIELYAGIFMFQFNHYFSCFTSSQVVYRKPPWTLQDILQCLKKHWIAVFGQIIQRKKLQLVLNLIDFFQSSKFSKVTLVYTPRLHWFLHWFPHFCRENVLHLIVLNNLWNFVDGKK